MNCSVTILRGTACRIMWLGCRAWRVYSWKGRKLTIQELTDAETARVTYVQYTDMEFCQRSPCNELSPMKYHDGVWRIGVRLRRPKIGMKARHPAILSARHHVTSSTDRSYGYWTCASITRQCFGQIKDLVNVRAVLSCCIPCKKFKFHLQHQCMADLIVDRTAPGKPPFMFVGIDYFGLLLIKRTQTTLKIYGCLFTCLTSRAIHIEVSTSLKTHYSGSSSDIEIQNWSAPTTALTLSVH